MGLLPSKALYPPLVLRRIQSRYFISARLVYHVAYSRGKATFKAKNARKISLEAELSRSCKRTFMLDQSNSKIKVLIAVVIYEKFCLQRHISLQASSDGGNSPTLCRISTDIFLNVRLGAKSFWKGTSSANSLNSQVRSSVPIMLSRP